MGTSLDFQTYLKQGGKIRHELSVYFDGTVVDRDMRSASPVYKVVVRLTADQMDRINRLIRRTRPAIMRFELSGARCFMAAFTHNKYTADNFSVLLRDGDMCDGGFNVNIRPAAKKLVNVLNVLESAAHSRMAIVEVEHQVEAALR